MKNKIEVDAAFLANVLSMLSYQQGFIEGVGQGLGKKLEAMDVFLGDMHSDILRLLEVQDEKSK